MELPRFAYPSWIPALIEREKLNIGHAASPRAGEPGCARFIVGPGRRNHLTGHGRCFSVEPDELMQITCGGVGRRCRLPGEWVDRRTALRAAPGAIRPAPSPAEFSYDSTESGEIGVQLPAG